jgi:tetratricopeptide (TPR) repeat protein
MKYSGFSLITAATLIFLLSAAIAAYPAANSQSMAERATIALKAAIKIKNPDTNEITNLILREKFEEFEKLSRNYENKFVQEQLYESPLNKLYAALDCKNASLLAKLDKWVQTRPSYISYGARGVYKVNRGYEIRGCKYINETPPENIARMTQLHQEARSDLLFAIQQNGRLTPAYCALILIEKASGNTEGMKNILDTAVRSIPETYYVRYTYLSSLHPRWGGSYEQMQEYAGSLDNDALINPRLWSLKGEVPAERGFTAMLNKDYPQAIRYYTEALSYGGRMSFLKNRGYMYMEVKQYDPALKDFQRYRKYDQSDREVNGYIEYCKKGNRR